MSNQQVISAKSNNRAPAHEMPSEVTASDVEKLLVETAEVMQAAMDQSEKNWQAKFAEIEARYNALETNVRISVVTHTPETAKLASEAKTKRELRTAFYAAVDDNVAKAELAGVMRPMLHLERRTAILAGIVTAIAGAGAGIAATRLFQKRAEVALPEGDPNPEATDVGTV